MFWAFEIGFESGLCLSKFGIASRGPVPSNCLNF